MTDIEYLNKSIKEKIVERVKNGFFDGAGGYLKAMDYYAKGLISLDTVKSIEAEIEAWEEAQYIETPVETEIKDETILDDDEGTETEVEGTETENGIIEDSANEESTESEAEPLGKTE